ncbi:MAG: hypothetical protein COA88_11635 [Kordia sp.]|nr:MAG: hypothetical protein COA88_11635 [Kordia sp.]
MNKLLHYTIFFCALLSVLSCKKQADLILVKTIENTSIKQQSISVSSNVLNEILLKLKKDSLSFKLKNKDSVLAFYELRNGKAAWEAIQNRNALYTAISTADKQGLNPSDYNLNKIKEIITSDPFSTKNNAAIDILFTDTSLSYSYHLANGRFNPKKLYNDWKLDANVFKFNSILSNSLNEKSLDKSFQKFTPQHTIYKQLLKQLPASKALVSSDSLRTITEHGSKIRPNKSSTRIINIRKRLNELGFLQDSLITQSKVLDTLLQQSVRDFQTSKKIKTDAIIGIGTIDALNESYQDQYNSILANLERWRWFPRYLGENYILVNISDYKLKYITKNDTTQYTIIVGKTARKTPVFSSQISHLDFNPKWFIPPTIKKEDIIPAATKDIDYLRKKNISVFHKEKRMILDSINWNSSAPLSYRYVQGAGDSNALGRVKIIFPNKFSVYLHDTPSKSLFNKNYRARSSGCVRVQNVFSLAADILNFSNDKITNLVDHKLTKRIHVTKDIKVHLFYWSVVFNNKSEPIFLNDVYKLDKELAKKLAN